MVWTAAVASESKVEVVSATAAPRSLPDSPDSSGILLLITASHSNGVQAVALKKKKKLKGIERQLYVLPM